ncbi:hypothetical protein IHQ68_12790 [Chelatococcus sambhunathii]|uniref:Meckel syndrome type 1 protein n=1 Tax=Chelatococcus sambhunathii TaxID=363953 RepID=A0ABU1DHD1_9HYPH|nr:hypothetical protein [Chelatococcus sambhunathii]MDR4307494.1 hypothetical protein [Chelatococcus sambhunathii]
MPFVLYALGAGLMAWAGYLMLAGESYAAIDIAASLAGWGAFTIGLGAVTAALQRLTKAVGASRRAAASPADDTKAGRRERSEGKADGAAAKARPEERQRNRLLRADPAPPPEPIAPPTPVVAPPVSIVAPLRTPEPAPAEAGADAGEASPEKPDEASKAAGGEKRSMRAALRRPVRAADEPKVEAPPVAVSKLGGGLSLRRRRAEPPLAEEPQDGATAPTQQPVTAPERLEPSATRPIMPIRATPVVKSPAEPAPVDEPVIGEAHATEARSQDVAPPTPQVAEDVKPEADAAPVPTADETETPPAASGQLEAPAPESPPVPEPAANEPAAARPAPAGQPPVPEWLARARARREARLRTDTPRAPERPRFVREPEPAVETPPAPPRSPEPDAEPADAEPHPALDQAASAEPPVSPDPTPVSPPEAERADEPVPEAADRRLVSEGEHNGVMYRFYDDGSVEAQSPHGVRRFASVDDLRRAVMNARGPGRLDADPGAAPEVLAPVETDPLDVALAELEGGARPAPKLHVDPEDRLGRL